MQGGGDAPSSLQALPWTLGEQIWPLLGPKRESPMRQSPRGQRGIRMLADIQGPHPPSSGEMHPDKKEIGKNCQETSMDE